MTNAARRVSLHAAPRGHEGSAVTFDARTFPDRRSAPVAAYEAQPTRELGRPEAEIARQLEDAQRLRAVSSRLIRGDDVDELYDQLIDTAMGVARSEFGSIQMFDAERGVLELLRSRNFHPASAAFWQVVHTGSASTCGAALRDVKRVVVEDTETSALLAGSDDLEHYRLSGIRAVQSTPLVSRSGAFVGMMSTHWREPHCLSERELGLLDVLARQAADLIERVRSEDALRRANAALELTSAQLRDLAAGQRCQREAADARIARELHDELGSELTSLRWNLESLRDRVPHGARGEIARELRSLMRLTDRMLESVRRIASGLRPPMLDDLGLAEAIEWQAQEFRRQSGIPCVCDLDIDHVRLDAEGSTAVYRIVQEAFTNIGRHAEASSVQVSLRCERGELVATIRDDGRGIRAEEVARPQALGLLGMRERARLSGGTLRIDGLPGQGTCVEVRIPAQP